MLLLLYFTLFLMNINHINASFCGNDSLPYYFEVSNYGQLTLRCLKPNCLNFQASNAFKFNNVDGAVVTARKIRNNRRYDVGDQTNCDSTFKSKKRCQDGEWLAEILPETNISNHLSLRCCRNSVMKNAKFQNIVDVTKNEIFEGGDVYEKGILIAFDYISNVVKYENNKGINYELFINRVYCNLTFSFQPKKNAKNNKIETKYLFQAPLVEADIDHFIDGEVIQNGNLQTISGNSFNSNTNFKENQEISNSQQVLQEIPNPTPVSSVQQHVNPNFQAPMPSSLQFQIQQTPLQQPFQSLPMQPIFHNPSLAQQPSNTFSSDSGCSYSSSFGATCNSYLCFSGDTMVTTYGGIKKRMDELDVDEWVLTVEKDEYSYSKINAWLHRKPNIMAEFIKLTLDDGKQLKMTKNHYIYIGDCENANSRTTLNVTNYQLTQAENVSLKDCLLVANENLTLTETQITKIEVVEQRGIYSPLTKSGNIFVNDIFASCYSNINVPQLQRLLSYLNQQIQNFISSFYDIGSNHNEIDLIPGFGTFTDIIQYYILLNK